MASCEKPKWYSSFDLKEAEAALRDPGRLRGAFVFSSTSEGHAFWAKQVYADVPYLSVRGEKRLRAMIGAYKRRAA